MINKIERVQELLYRAEFFLKSYEKMERLYKDNIPSTATEKFKYKTSDLASLIRMNAILYYYETVSCIASLLREKNTRDSSKNELSFAMLIGYVNNSQRDAYEQERKRIFNFYKKSYLNNIRNKIANHKDVRTSGDPVASFINFVNPKFVKPCHSVINDLKTLLEKYLSEEYLMNDYFSNHHSKAINKFIKMVKSEIENIE